MNLVKNFIFNTRIINIIFFGLFLRVIALIFFKHPIRINPGEDSQSTIPFGDTDIYIRIGNELFDKNSEFYINGLVSSPVHMPGYPTWIYLLNFLSQNQIGYLTGDIIISGITIYIIYQLSQVIFNDEWVSKISAFIFSIYPFSIFYSISGLSETLYVFLILSSILLFYKNYFFYGSIVIILSIYVKGISDYIAPILILIFSFFVYKDTFKQGLKRFFLYFLTYCVIMFPWWVHNWNKYNKFVRTDLAYGYHMYAGNNFMNKSGGGIGGTDVDHSQILGYGIRTLTDPSGYIRSDKIFKKEAYNYILEDPNRFLKQYIKKFYRFWSFVPYAKEYKNLTYSIISFVSFGFIFFLSIIFLLQNFKSYFYKISPLLTFLGIITAIYTLTIVSLRYRYPIEPIMIIFASFSLKRILKFYKLL